MTSKFWDEDARADIPFRRPAEGMGVMRLAVDGEVVRSSEYMALEM